MNFDVEKVRADFPILSRQVNGRPLVYLDNGASAQKPRVVIDAITRAYEAEYANVHRGLHFLSNLATENYERVRAIIARFLNAPRENEVIFTSGATEGINLVSYGWAAPRLQAGDEIVLSVLEHHANIVPWHFLRERQGVVLKWVEPEPDGSLPPEKVLAAVGPRTRLIAVTHMSNVTGTVVDVGAIARGTSVPVLADGSQAAVHMPVDLSALGVDFYCITGHKLYGPSGSGAIWIRAERQAEMRPFMGGGDMIRTVTRESIDYADPPLRFEAGTPGIANQIGLGAALEYLMALGMENVAAHERDLRDYARDRLRSLNWLSVQGDAADKGAIFSMTMQGAHAHDISTILDKRGIAVRAGTHCAMPLLDFFGVSATARASFAMYNTRAEVDALIDGLTFCRELFA
ncbi:MULTISPECIES: cysteine desulfurase [Paracoccus]|jgi:cysteine desulfurase/selenocysteine lyase|uniref:Cysteine desulfurase n=1 Tax=Paracoccus denitrificans (strain Pd 1222) TaxID=318586 RepID=A1B942_PARDP|nr:MULTISPECIES: cysteine desulfurase [Paracoccus]ABL72036.1 cysteine desulfurase [Paracoccus denitrificans PD1222]MBB4626057.1 cysteine desulfurase/selenocysteine lyase [Paracoccus denitrificans]MCU7426783.1 cysteine desulfurase [Paracoccus denitrificans]QAR28614.1 cysteine desulfurase [Paracoccus denitrificans]UPV96758.1 cysteine desulfurase [Paracoccus denitrificans]